MPLQNLKRWAFTELSLPRCRHYHIAMALTFGSSRLFQPYANGCVESNLYWCFHVYFLFGPFQLNSAHYQHFIHAFCCCSSVPAALAALQTELFFFYTHSRWLVCVFTFRVYSFQYILSWFVNQNIKQINFTGYSLNKTIPLIVATQIIDSRQSWISK